MTPDRWRRIKALFADAKAREPSQRIAFLTEACGEDTELLEEVKSLLAADDSADVIDNMREALVSALNLQPRERIVAGQKISHYTLHEEMGRGGMGVVYEAFDDRLRRKVALKFLPPQLSANSDLKARFMKEARAASALDHPNICTIFDIGEADGLVFLAMAYYTGETLAERIKSSPPDIEECLYIVSQIAAGLDKAHEAGIVHRDVKPSNIMLTRDGDVKILDFGVAKFTGGSDITRPGVRVGTIAYMSPEQIRGDEIDHRADIWSLGVLFYEMLTGEHPFRSNQDAATMHAILETQPSPVSHFRSDAPSALDSIVRCMLKKSPDSRYGSLTEFLHDIADLTAGSTLRALRREIQKMTLRAELPVLLTSFIGRDQELERITELIRQARLVTLTGPGGTGKTRLGIEAASRTAPDFNGNVAFVSLASTRDPDLVVSAVMQALGIQEDKTKTHLEHLVSVLKERSLLLVLDNFEQVISAAPLIAALLTRCPRVKTIVTSRIALRISGEHIFPVPPLPLPPAGAAFTAASLSGLASTALFEARSRAVNPGFRVTDDNAIVIAEICRRLDGIPLAIELAAARIKLFSPESLLARLEQRLDILTAAPRDHPSRHQTLRHAIAWSYDLLTGEEQAFFRILSIFVGGCTLEAIQAVASDSLEETFDCLTGVSILLDHNLIRREDESSDSRFFMLETIREFGIERLKEANEFKKASRAHLSYFLNVAEQAQYDLIGPEPTRNLDYLQREHDNLRAALTRAEQAGDLESCLRFAVALWRFWSTRSHLSEGIERTRRFLSHPAAAEGNATRARALSALGTMCFYVGRIEDSSKYLEESIAIWKELGDAQGTATVLNHLGWVAGEHGDFARTLELSTQALELHRANNERRGIAVSLNNLVWRANYCGEYEEAVRVGWESLKIRQEIGDVRGAAYAYVNLGWSEILHGDYATALELLSKGRPDLEEIGDPLMIAWYYMLLGMLWLEQGDYAQARPSLIRCMSIWNRENHNTGLAWVLTLLAEIDVSRDQFASAESKLSLAEKIWSEHNNRWGVGIVYSVKGKLEARKREVKEAIRHFTKSLQLSFEVNNKREMASAMDFLAQIILDQGNELLAVQLLGVSAGIRQSWKIPVQLRYRRDFEVCLERLQTGIGADFDTLWKDALAQSMTGSMESILKKLKSLIL